MKVIFFLILISSLSGCQSGNDYQLVWADEFNYNGLPDSIKWSFDTDGNSWQWGNNELQYYTADREENATVRNGFLHIIARKEDGFTQPYTSARLITKGKGDWLYGRIEVKAKLCGGKGAWPAIWMLPTDSEYGAWPTSGELDIMEHVGYEPDSVYFTIHTENYNHTKGTQQGNAVFLPDAEEAFHCYAIEWTPESCTFLLDKEEVFQFEKAKQAGSGEWPFDKRFHLLLNVAVGGNWGGKHGVDESMFPCTLQVDYVRVYQKTK
jgi:beta-glucanase (GH16 family)